MAKAESCCNCVYAKWSPGQWIASLPSVFPPRPSCANHPDLPGRMRDCPYGRVCVNFRLRPPTPKGETVKTIALGDGFVAYVDAADYEWLSQWNWHMDNGYAARRENGKWIYMHRLIMKPPKGMLIDHKDRNKLDNTRENLRPSTHQENLQNTAKRDGTASRFKGVCYSKDRNKWLARLYFMGAMIWLGYFDDEIEAARAYDRAAVEYFGEFARLNFPEEWPPQRRAEVMNKGKGKKTKGKSRKVKSGKSPARARTRGRRAPKRSTRDTSRPGHRSRATGHKPKARTAKAAKPRATRDKRRATHIARRTRPGAT